MAADTTTGSVLIMKNYLTFTCDRNFLPLGKALLRSLHINSPIYNVVARVVNCTSSEIENYKLQRCVK